jgi:ankyrin repeat protein
MHRTYNYAQICKGDVRGDTPLHAAAASAAEEGSLEVLEFLLDAAEVSPELANQNGMTPAHLASSVAKLAALAAAGARLHCVDALSSKCYY